MKEEERQKRLAIIHEKVEDAKRLRKMQKELNRLKSSPDVKRYLELQDELEDEEILTKEEISKKVMEKSPTSYRDCSHDIWYYRGGYRVEYDRGPESRDRYYRENDPSRIQLYIYRCLDCYQEIEVSVKENEEFLKKNCVIKTKVDFAKCRKTYCELLCTNQVDNAYKKLLKKINL